MTAELETLSCASAIATVGAARMAITAPRVEWLECTRPSRGRPGAHLGDVDREHRAVGRDVAVLRVLRGEEGERALAFLAVVEHARAAAQPDPPEALPVLVVVVDEDGDVGPRAGVLDPPQRARALRLAVHCGVQRVAVE